MKKISLTAFLMFVFGFVSMAHSAGVCDASGNPGSPVCESKVAIQGQNGEVVLPCTTQVAAGLAVAVPADKIWSAQTNAPVAKVCELMVAGGFKTVFAIPCGDEDAYLDNRDIQFNNEVYHWTAIIYKSRSGVVDSRVAVRTITKNGIAATRLEELELVLAGKIPYAVTGGLWLPSKRIGVAVEFGYGKLGQNAKVETVATKSDGIIIKHITQDGYAPYFAVETNKIIKVKEIELRTVNVESTTNIRSESATLPSEEELRNRGIIPETGRLVRVIAATNYEVDDKQYREETIAIEKTVEKTVTSVVIYPYAD